MQADNTRADEMTMITKRAPMINITYSSSVEPLSVRQLLKRKKLMPLSTNPDLRESIVGLCRTRFGLSCADRHLAPDDSLKLALM
jgi:hypothetical protein